MSNGNNPRDIIYAVTELVKEVPIYEDALQPAAKELGKSLEIAAKAINVALGPIRGLIWGFDQIEEFISTKVAEKLQRVPIENIITPNINIAGPTLEALRFAGQEEVLKEMYANLLASSMDSSTVEDAHPAFVKIIKELSPEEAKVVKFLFQRKEFPDVYSNVWFDKITGRGSYASGTVHVNAAEDTFYHICSEVVETKKLYGSLDNLLRLKILSYEQNSSQSMKETDVERRSSGAKKDFKTTEKISIDITTTASIQFTSFGCRFIKACVQEKETA